MAKAKKPTAKRPSGSKPAVPPKKPARRVKQTQYKSFRLHKRIKPVSYKLPSVIGLLVQVFRLMRKHWRLYGGIASIYGIFMLLLIRGFSSGIDVVGLKEFFDQAFSGNWGALAGAAALFGTLVSTTGASSSQASFYQPILLMIISLATIWSTRQVLANEKIRVRDAFYRGMYPIIPFTLVLGVIGLQLLPMSVGSWLYNTVLQNGIAITTAEKGLWFVLFLLVALSSLYMICSSVFALLIVSLPEMTPIKALKSARQLVLHRRWTVLRKVILLPILLLLLGAVIMTPFLLWVPRIAEWVFFLLSTLAWLVILIYIYVLYRELLNE